MPTYSAEHALLPDGWAADVRIEADEAGVIRAVQTSVTPHDADIRLGHLVVPGMIDLHSHAFQRAMSGLAERGSPGGDTFWSWRERMYGFLAALTPDDVEAIATQLYVELLEGGYTSVVEFHYLHQELDGKPYADVAELAWRIVRAAETASIGLTLLPTLYRASGFGGTPATAGQRRFTLTEGQLLDVFHAVESASVDRGDRAAGLALHSLRAVPPDAMSRVLQALEGRACPIHIHVAEQLREVEDCLAWSGRRPVQWLLDNADVDGRWCLIHATHLDDAEVGRMADTGAVAGLCPSTEANLGDGLFRFVDYTQAGGRWGVGSDSHVTLDAAAELRLLEYGQRLVRRERNVATRGTDRSTGQALWQAALRGGTQAAGRPVGALQAGHRADWIVLDETHPVLVGKRPEDALDGLVFCEGARPVRDVWVGGTRVVEAGRHPDRVAVADRFGRTMRRLLT